jgi:hypothetical protein
MRLGGRHPMGVDDIATILELLRQGVKLRRHTHPNARYEIFLPGEDAVQLSKEMTGTLNASEQIEVEKTVVSYHYYRLKAPAPSTASKSLPAWGTW